MSRGYGRCQRAILKELGSREWFYLLELLPIHYRKADYNALNRAAWALDKAGRVSLVRYVCGAAGFSQAKLLCCRPGRLPRPACDCPPPCEHLRERPEFNHARRRENLSVGRVTPCHPSHT
jgi:hypothetical protein